MNAVCYYGRVWFGFFSKGLNPGRPFKVLSAVTQLILIVTLSTLFVTAGLKNPEKTLKPNELVFSLFIVMRAVHLMTSLLHYRNQSAKSTVFAIIAAVLLVVINLVGQLIVFLLGSRLGTQLRINVGTVSIKVIALELILWDCII
jgi:hypothetical protein